MSLLDGKPEPSQVRQTPCEYCGDKSTKAHELKRKGKGGAIFGMGMFIYTCPRHHEKAERAIDAKLGKKKETW